MSRPEPSATSAIPGPIAPPAGYRGRLAPSPTGYLHLGHGKTFLAAAQRARQAHGVLVLRIEDLDLPRCRPEFEAAILEDLAWLGIAWQEGPDVGGPFGPYRQSERLKLHGLAWERLRAAGSIYPCTCSRRDVQQAAQAPHDESGEPIYPGFCRPETGAPPISRARAGVNWRFRVPDGRPMAFEDGRTGWHKAEAGVHFGDFLVWRKDDTPAYQLAVVADDAAMSISEVVRGEDLLLSTFRQLLLYEALSLAPPAFFHAPLVCDAAGKRLAKRDGALSLRALRAGGIDPRNLP